MKYFGLLLLSLAKPVPSPTLRPDDFETDNGIELQDFSGNRSSFRAEQRFVDIELVPAGQDYFRGRVIDRETALALGFAPEALNSTGPICIRPRARNIVNLPMGEDSHSGLRNRRARSTTTAEMVEETPIFQAQQADEPEVEQHAEPGVEPEFVDPEIGHVNQDAAANEPELIPAPLNAREEQMGDAAFVCGSCMDAGGALGDSCTKLFCLLAFVVPGVYFFIETSDLNSAS